MLLVWVILPFCKGARIRNVMQPWPVSASLQIHPEPYSDSHCYMTTSTGWQTLEPLLSSTSNIVTAIRSELLC